MLIRARQQRADAADEARFVVVDDVEHVARQLGLDADAEDVHQTRRLGAEQRAGDRTRTLRGLHRHAHEGVERAIAVVPYLAYIKPALLGEEGALTMFTVSE